MTDWRTSVLAFSALPELASLMISRQAAWVWSREGRLLWANPAGGARLGRRSFANLSRRDIPAGHVLRREIESLMRSAPDKGTMARLRLVEDLHAVPVSCRCRRLRAGEERGLLTIATDREAATLPSVADLVAFFSDAEGAAAVFDGSGRGPVEGADTESGAESEARFIAFTEEGRPRRLYFPPRHAEGTSAETEPDDETDAGSTGTQPVAVPAPDEPLQPDQEKGAEPEPPARASEEAMPLSKAPGSPEPDRARPAEPARATPLDTARASRMTVVASKPVAAPAAVQRPATSAGSAKGTQSSATQPKPPLPKPPAADAAELPESPGKRSIMAGRVARELSRKPVRFLWQTDSADRFLFVSPGLAQVVGRNAEIVGEHWQDAAARLGLDPNARIARAVAQRDTWSGQTAWWPIEGSNVRVPAELTALPIFGADHSFQGYRGFGVLRPAEALMPAAFETRFGRPDAAAPVVAQQSPPYEEAIATMPAISAATGSAAAAGQTAVAPANVVPIRADLERSAEQARLTAQERSAFEEIAAALRERVVEAPAAGSRSEQAEAAAEAATAAEARDLATPALKAPNKASTAAPDDRAEAAAPPSPQPSADAAAGRNPGNGPAVAAALSAPDEAVPPPKVSPDPVPAATLEPEPPAIAEAHPPASGPEQAPPADSRPSAPLRSQPGAASSPPVSESVAQRRVREMTAILDIATDGVVMLDAEGTIESVNASAEALFGLEAHELQGTDFSELLMPESRQMALDYLSGMIDNGVASLLDEGREIEAQAGPGSIPLFMTMGRISGEGGGRYCAVLRDITQWKRTEAELVAAKLAAEAASSQKSEFIARVSHEIRTPLNAIIGFAEVMIEERFGTIENERYRDYIRDIRASGEHVVSLINDLLDISKIEAGKLDLEFIAVPLNDLVRDCIGLMQPQANRARVVLRSSLSRDVPAIVADPRTLRQIVLNLLSNSVKFTGPGGQVIASTSLLESGEALLRIRDTGEGMTEEELARAMEPFRQIATATLSDRTGTGLGLPLTKALVEANRASLAIRSARGEGTVVTITFPPTRVLSE